MVARVVAGPPTAGEKTMRTGLACISGRGGREPATARDEVTTADHIEVHTRVGRSFTVDVKPDAVGAEAEIAGVVATPSLPEPLKSATPVTGRRAAGAPVGRRCVARDEGEPAIRPPHHKEADGVAGDGGLMGPPIPLVIDRSWDEFSILISGILL